MICPKCSTEYEGEACPVCSAAEAPAQPVSEPPQPEREAPAPAQPQPVPEAPAPAKPQPPTTMDYVLIALAVLGGLLLVLFAMMMLTDRMPEWAGSGSRREDDSHSVFTRRKDDAPSASVDETEALVYTALYCKAQHCCALAEGV